MFDSLSAENIEQGSNGAPDPPNRAAMRMGSEFAHSLAYSATQSPLNGLVQLADKIAGTNLLPKVQFMSAPVAAEFGSPEWHGQVLGGAVGVACDFALLHKVLPHSSEVSRLSTINRAAVTGAVLNGVFRPSDSDEDFLLSRITGAAVGAASFAALSALQAPFDNLLLQGGVKSRFLSGALSGATVGAGEAWLNNNITSKKRDILESMYSSALTGGLLHQFQIFGKQQPAERLCKNLAESQTPTSLTANSETARVSPSDSTSGNPGRSVTVRTFGLGDTTPILEIAARYKLPPRTGGPETLVLEVDGKVRGYAILNDQHLRIGEVAVLPEFRPCSARLINEVKRHVQSLGGVWETSARSSTSGKLLEAMAKRNTIKVLEQSAPYHGPTEDMVDLKFIFRPPTSSEAPLSGEPLRRHLGLSETEPVRLSAPGNLHEDAHAQSDQWISLQMISGSLKRGVRIAPGFGEPVGTNGRQRGAKYALIEVDETRDPTLRTIIEDANQRFAGLRAHPALHAEELARYVRRICNPSNEGPTLEQRAQAMLLKHAGDTIPLGEFIRTNNCLCVQDALLYKTLADRQGIPTAMRSANEHAWAESLIDKQWRVFDSARATYNADPYIKSTRRR